jgi:hypothetical protein
LYAIKFDVPGAVKLFGEYEMPAMLQEINQRDGTLEEAAVSDGLAVVDESREPNFAAGRAIAAFGMLISPVYIILIAYRERNVPCSPLHSRDGATGLAFSMP